MSDLLLEVRELSCNKRREQYNQWCEKRIPAIEERIKTHATNGKCYVWIRDSRYKADKVYKYFFDKGFKISEPLSWVDQEWNGTDKISGYQVKISWEMEDE